VLLIIASIFGLIGWLIGRPKGASRLGVLAGVFCSLLGIIVVAVMPASEERRVR
jgi:hypothetical protein